MLDAGCEILKSEHVVNNRDRRVFQRAYVSVSSHLANAEHSDMIIQQLTITVKA